MVTNNKPNGDYPHSSLPSQKQLKTRRIKDCIGWTTIYFRHSQNPLNGTWIQIRTYYKVCRNGVVRAWLSGVKSGDGICVWDGQRFVRNATRQLYGWLLWDRVRKARGRRHDTDFKISRAEAVYVSNWIDADLGGKEIHHRNADADHRRWKVETEKLIAAVAGHTVKSEFDWVRGLDDRPANLIALPKQEHYLIHKREGTLYCGNYEDLDEDSLNEDTVRDSFVNKEFLRIGELLTLPAPLIKHRGVARYGGGKSVVCLRRRNYRFELKDLTNQLLRNRCDWYSYSVASMSYEFS